MTIDELTASRREEIIAACRKAYETKSVHQTKMSDIAKYVSFSRPTIYNYFETKEEVFLALFQTEFTRWAADLDAIQPTKPFLSGTSSERAKRVSEFTAAVDASLAERQVVFRILSMNFHDMQTRSRREHFAAFQNALLGAREAVVRAVARAFPSTTDADRAWFSDRVGACLFGSIPYTIVREQDVSMMTAGRAGKLLAEARECVREMFILLLTAIVDADDAP